MFSNLSIKTKLTSVLVAGLVFMAIVSTYLSVQKSMDALLYAQFEKLETAETAKKDEITKYLNYLKGLLTSLAGQTGTKEAFLEFESGFYNLSTDLGLDINQIKQELKSDFEKNYLADVNYDVPNSAQRRSIDQYLPNDENALIAQYLFITKNSAALGEKNNLVYDKNYKSSYMIAHKDYHESFDKVLNAYSLYDIFMVDLKGNLIYTDFKEKDFATNLKSGVYSNTGIAQAYKKALDLKEGEVAFIDFAPYEPSYNAAASFIATPIFIYGELKGVLIFQMPVDEINDIMQFGGHFKEAGLGESGETYLVGSDYKMRSNSRFQKDINDPLIQKLGTTIGVWEVKTQSTQAALEGKEGHWVIPDYRGVDVLSVYNTIDVFGQAKWAIISEIDEEEALIPALELRNVIAISSIIILALIILINMYFMNKTLIKPLYKFQNGLLDFFKYLNKEKSTVTMLDDKLEDELGTMSKVVNKNINKTKAIIEEDQSLIQEVKNVVSKVNDGYFDQNISSNTSNESLNELKDLLNQMLSTLKTNVSEDLNKIQEAFEEYQKLNFSYRLENCEGKTSAGLNNLAEIINNMLVENKRNGIMLNDSSQSLLKNISTLNTASNEAAASLEETAAALEQITGNISNNTGNVVKMASYANELNSSANEGEKLANQTTVSMDEINTQVAAISEAISVIDQIAFQTNILSLNAAVEAATAGEAGKGFAVVAGEVRNLAARSAEAASEIKMLVENATNKANEGKDISDKMIEGYHGLNNNISKTIDLIKDVEMASKEQQSGIEQINDAVNSLDQQTQQNASVASQSQEIANTTSAIADKIVEDADEKEFIGKGEIDRRKKSIDTSYKGSEKRDVESRIKKFHGEPSSTRKSYDKVDTSQNKTQKTQIKSNTSKTDEWESF